MRFQGRVVGAALASLMVVGGFAAVAQAGTLVTPVGVGVWAPTPVGVQAAADAAFWSVAPVVVAPVVPVAPVAAVAVPAPVRSVQAPAPVVAPRKAVTVPSKPAAAAKAALPPAAATQNPPTKPGEIPPTEWGTNDQNLKPTPTPTP